MSFLATLLNLAHHHNQQQPQAQSAQHQQPLQVHQAAPQQLGNNTPEAQIYANNPRDPRVTHTDPAQFGYPADNSGQQLQTQPLLHRLNMAGMSGYQPQGYVEPVQQNGMYQQPIQAPRTPWQNMTGQPVDYVNPQIEDDGYNWYQ